MFNHKDLFRIGDGVLRDFATVPTGFAALDNALAGQGWPCGALTELLCDGLGLGELSLLLPAHRALMHETSAHYFWIAPPCLPYAPALCAAGVHLPRLMIINATQASDGLWAAEQLLSAARLVVLWQKSFIADVALRRLQYAAAKGGAVCWLVRPSQFVAHASPASLRIALSGNADGALTVNLIKRRGLAPGMTLTLETRTMPCLSAQPGLTPTPTVPTERAAVPAWLGSATGIETSVRPRAIAPDR